MNKRPKVMGGGGGEDVRNTFMELKLQKYSKKLSKNKVITVCFYYF